MVDSWGSCSLTTSPFRGKITFYTHPPEEQTLPSHLSTEIVEQWGKAFDLEALLEEEKKDLKGELGSKIICT